MLINGVKMVNEGLTLIMLYGIDDVVDIQGNVLKPKVSTYEHAGQEGSAVLTIETCGSHEDDGE